MTDQTKRALERLPKGPLTAEMTGRGAVVADRTGLSVAHLTGSHSHSLAELAARSPALLEMLDQLVEQIGWLPPAITGPISYTAAETLLRETTRAMLQK